MALLLGVKAKAKSSDDAAREARKLAVKEELKNTGFPLTIQWEAKAMINGVMVTLGAITAKPTYFEKSGRVAYMGSGPVTLMGVKDQSTITTFLPFSVDKSAEAVASAEERSNTDLDEGETT